MDAGTMIRRILVPNRGEIAARIARTCRTMGIETVLAHAEGDVSPQARRLFDELISLGSAEAAQSYLNVGQIIDAARERGADAIHPGYGFLSERASLAQACAEAGLVFIGPSADTIEKMGSKSGSRHLMKTLGVPVVPGYDGDDQQDSTLVAEADRIGFPLLVKASAGGGGKGMKIVRSRDEVANALASARREATKAFGDRTLLLERYIEHPRHVEIQILGDSHGTVLHLFERDCSIQRRHQKIVEESPAPLYGDDLRQQMTKAALAAADGVGYQNAGTVEFIVAPDGAFYFLEMNTRLQVEHPVTEEVLGLDLVRAQIEVADGKPVPWGQDSLIQRGHAIECRIYAEDPDEGFLPQTGRIEYYREPAGPGVRVDSGVGQGTGISVHFDPLLAKLIAIGRDRDEAIARLRGAMEDFAILGTRTNLSYLRRIITHTEFAAGRVSTAFVVDHEEDLRAVPAPEAASVAAVLASEGLGPGSPAKSAGTVRSSVWEMLGDWGR
ncbi:MAG: biotin carboxylase N-terminal domain-containing protein [Acidobacteriota bacterium]